MDRSDLESLKENLGQILHIVEENSATSKKASIFFLKVNGIKFGKGNVFCVIFIFPAFSKYFLKNLLCHPCFSHHIRDKIDFSCSRH